jgi:hypothetical protein
MRYFSDKVVQIDGKLFTCCEIITNPQNERKIVIVREVVKTSRTYEHPLHGLQTLRKFDIFRGSKKAYLIEDEWEGLPNINEENLKVELGSMK